MLYHSSYSYITEQIVIFYHLDDVLCRRLMNDHSYEGLIDVVNHNISSITSCYTCYTRLY